MRGGGGISQSGRQPFPVTAAPSIHTHTHTPHEVVLPPFTFIVSQW